MTRPVPRLIVLLPAILTIAIAPLCALGGEHPAIDLEKGWKSLFNGKDLTGWHTVTSDDDPVAPDAWAVEDGALTRKKKGYLRSDRQYGNFILEMEFKVGPPDEKDRRTNSGILIRHKTDPELKGQKKPYWHDGLLEVQIFDSHDLEPTKQTCGALYDMVAASSNPMIERRPLGLPDPNAIPAADFGHRPGVPIVRIARFRRLVTRAPSSSAQIERVRQAFHLARHVFSFPPCLFVSIRGLRVEICGSCGLVEQESEWVF